MVSSFSWMSFTSMGSFSNSTLTTRSPQAICSSVFSSPLMASMTTVSLWKQRLSAGTQRSPASSYSFLQ
ncbi:hypothetical protein FGO68_gene17383 [Halteria grandinella]|uniref:Uncharacterized protein n=1 Tax=Halteria grandinella TaxID=5974 RepID=A0A8J8SWN2_HALGN|nr:hypothetical protein FGO68_gene17383 [Halteria grandinella]